MILAAILSCMVSTVSAGKLRYSYISLTYAKFNSALEKYAKELDGNSTSLEISITLRPHVAFIAGYSNGHADVTSSGITAGADIQSTSFGALIHLPINETADFLLGTTFVNGEHKTDVTSDSEDADGGNTFIGARAMALDDLEVYGLINKSRIEELSNISFKLGAAYYFRESFSIDIGSAFDANGGLLALGISKYF